MEGKANVSGRKSQEGKEFKPSQVSRDKGNAPFLKSIDLNGFKTFVSPTHLEFAQGLNAVLVSQKYPVPSGLWDLFDAIRWVFRTRQLHGTGILFETASAEVKLTVVDEEGKELSVTGRVSKGNGEEFVTNASQDEVSRLKMFLLSDSDKSLSFGSTEIVVVYNDKQLAMQADAMIGITTDEAGLSKASVLSREGN